MSHRYHANEQERGERSMGRPAMRAARQDRIEPETRTLKLHVRSCLRFESGLVRREATPIDLAAPLWLCDSVA